MVRAGRKSAGGGWGGGRCVKPAVGGGGAAAGAVGAGVQHDQAVGGAEKDLRLADDAGAVVRGAVKEQDPAAVGILRTDFPAAEKSSIRRANVEILARGAGDSEGDVGYVDQIGSQLAANGMEERRADEPSGDRRRERRKGQQNQSDANQPPAQGCCPNIRECGWKMK